MKCPYESTLYIKTNLDGGVLLACLYVDDLIFTGNDPIMFGQFKEAMKSHFERTGMGLMTYFLGLEVLQIEDGIFVSQRKYAVDTLKCFKMELVVQSELQLKQG